MGETRPTIEWRAAGAALVVATGLLAAACGVGSGTGDAEKAELAAHRCEPLSSSTSDLSAAFPRLGPVVSADWCTQALGPPDTARLTVPGPHDWEYYGVVRLADTTAAEAWGPWQPTGEPEIPKMPVGLRSLVPAHGRWSYNGAGVYLDRSSATVVLGGAPADPIQP
ncbi:hypothetical protein [Embleya sp. NPDC001921]